MSDDVNVTVAIDRKISLGNYEMVNVYMAVANIEPGTSKKELEEALQTGELALQVIKEHMRGRIAEARAAGSQYLG